MSNLTSPPNQSEALLELRGRFQTQQAMADAFGTTQATVSRWLSDIHAMSPKWVLIAERRFGIPRHHLRPDVYPNELPQPGHFLGVDNGETRVAFVPHRGANGRHAA